MEYNTKTQTDNNNNNTMCHCYDSDKRYMFEISYRCDFDEWDKIIDGLLNEIKVLMKNGCDTCINDNDQNISFDENISIDDNRITRVFPKTLCAFTHWLRIFNSYKKKRYPDVEDLISTFLSFSYARDYDPSIRSLQYSKCCMVSQKELYKMFMENKITKASIKNSDLEEIFDVCLTKIIKEHYDSEDHHVEQITIGGEKYIKGIAFLEDI